MPGSCSCHSARCMQYHNCVCVVCMLAFFLSSSNQPLLLLSTSLPLYHYTIHSSSPSPFGLLGPPLSTLKDSIPTTIFTDKHLTQLVSTLFSSIPRYLHMLPYTTAPSRTTLHLHPPRNTGTNHSTLQSVTSLFALPLYSTFQTQTDILSKQFPHHGTR